jgi:hypothetical protein
MDVREGLNHCLHSAVILVGTKGHWRFPMNSGLVMVVFLLGLMPSFGLEDVWIEADMDYSPTSVGDPYRQLDIYTLVEAQDWPVMIYVHGGGWHTGDKRSVHEKPQAFLERGYVFVSVNYRLSPQVAFPTHAQDVAEAIAWVEEHVELYGGDPKRLFLMGHSAGGHLVALMATDERYLAAHGLLPTHLSGIIANDTAVYDLVGLGDDNAGVLPPLFAYTFGEDPEFWAFASPSRYVFSEKGIPPMICLYSAGQSVDQVNPERESSARAFVSLMNRENKMASVIGDVFRTHEEINQWFGLSGDWITEECFAFLDQVSTFSNFQFRRDCLVGTNDRFGQWLGGTEIMTLQTHQGKLFAGNGFWHEDPDQGSSGNPQIWVKHASGLPWQVEHTFPRPGRVGSMKSLTLTTDRWGSPLSSPVTLFLASPQMVMDGRTRVYVRHDATGTWMETIIDHPPVEDALQAYARTMTCHLDEQTGIHHVFAGTAASGLFRGAYDPQAPGWLVWEGLPELTGSGRMVAMAEANGELYLSVGSNGNPQDRDGGLFRRVDGPNPTWEFLWEWPVIEGKGPGLRGLTAVPDPEGQPHEVLLGSLEGPGVMVKIDPERSHEVSVELDFKQWFIEQWGSLGGSATLAAYNEMTAAEDPRTLAPVHLIGLFINHPNSPGSPYNGSYFLIRNASGAYAWAAIGDAHHPLADGMSLRGTRSLVVSPFAKERGRVLYAGGFDAAGGPWQNSAWIFRGSLPQEGLNLREGHSFPLSRVPTFVGPPGSD